MVGTGGISTFDTIGDDPETAPLLKKMLDPDGKPKVCERVWISSLNGKMNQYGGEGFGKLTAGYCSHVVPPFIPWRIVPRVRGWSMIP